MLNDQVIRVIAATAAIGIFAYPFVAPYLQGLAASFASMTKRDPAKQKMQDLQTVIELSARFSEAGSKEGVDLCHKIIDVILKQQK